MHEILNEYKALLGTVDAWFDQARKSTGDQVRCAAGCSACCRGLFDITLLDARLLQVGFAQLPQSTRGLVLEKAKKRLPELQTRWPGFAHPYTLNHMPDEEWTEMPEDDETPCPLLSDGCCLVYEHRPMLCRTHGIPNIDVSGEVFDDTWCTLNFTDSDPLLRADLRWRFRSVFEDAQRLFYLFTQELLGAPRNELDTFIPTALLIDFDRFDRHD